MPISWKGRKAALFALSCAVLGAGCQSTSEPAGPDGPAGASSVAAACPATPVAGRPSLQAELVTDALEQPVDLQTPGDPRHLFVVERAGRIRLIRDGQLAPAPFLDIRDRVSTEVTQEQGMLGLAFHPRYKENGRFYVNYTSRANQTHIVEFRATPGSDTADPGTERTLLVEEQPFYSHLGGQLRFGPDGLLYIGLGDGGSAADPQGNAQALGTLLGKILRIDPDGSPYVIPSTNPFVQNARARREIWALGLRNPWRFSFDPVTRDLYIGDVGQRRYEEIDVGLAARGGGENYGWAVTEGSACFPLDAPCSPGSYTLPVVQYGHDEGCAVVGGVVYRGCRMPGYAGTYF
jgi:glucose/arabinose dehydrogenase